MYNESVEKKITELYLQISFKYILELLTAKILYVTQVENYK